MAGNPPDHDTAVRVALLQERVTVLIESVKANEARTDVWRREMTGAVKAITDDVGELRVSHREFTDRLKHLEGQMVGLEEQVREKVGVVWFKGTWSVLLAIGAIITAAAAVATILRTLGALPR
jgi:hypothetical protein